VANQRKFDKAALAPLFHYDAVEDPAAYTAEIVDGLLKMQDLEPELMAEYLPSIVQGDDFKERVELLVASLEELMEAGLCDEAFRIAENLVCLLD